VKIPALVRSNELLSAFVHNFNNIFSISSGCRETEYKFPTCIKPCSLAAITFQTTKINFNIMIGQVTFNPDKTLSVNDGEWIYIYKYASFGSRLGARLVDVLIIIIPNTIIPIIAAWLYWSLQQSGKNQSTVGQNVFEIKTMSLDGEKISFGQATGRHFGNYLNVLTFFGGFFLFFFNKKKQCLHDYLSGCIVVKQIGIESATGTLS
jgi:RDD family